MNAHTTLQAHVITNPRRILFLGRPDSGVLTLLKDLTGSAPDPISMPIPLPITSTPPPTQSPLPPEPSETQIKTTTSGLTHALPLKTKYYTTTIPIWLDETSDAAAWQRDFESEEAGEVVRAVGGWGVCFRVDGLDGMGRRARGFLEADAVARGGAGGSSMAEAQGREEQDTEGDEEEREETTQLGSRARHHAAQLMRAIRSVIVRAHGGEEGAWDGVCLVVGMPAHGGSGTTASKIRERAVTEEERRSKEEQDEAWADLCYDLGFEYIDCSIPIPPAASISALSSAAASPATTPQNKDRDNDTDTDNDDTAGAGAVRGEKTGVPRVLEALETCDWESPDDVDVDLFPDVDFGGDDEQERPGRRGDGGGGEGGEETAGFALERMQMEREFAGLGRALRRNDGHDTHDEDADHEDSDDDDDEEEEEEEGGGMQVEELERMLGKLSAVRDMRAHMPEQERRRLAARTVNDIMKTL